MTHESARLLFLLVTKQPNGSFLFWSDLFYYFFYNCDNLIVFNDIMKTLAIIRMLSIQMVFTFVFAKAAVLTTSLINAFYDYF